MGDMEKKYSVRLSFEPIKLPPIRDILVLGRRLPQGKQGIIHSMEFLAPEQFELIEVPDDISSNIDAVLVNKAILKRMPPQRILEILSTYVFPYVSEGEAIRVDFTVGISYGDIAIPAS